MHANLLRTLAERCAASDDQPARRPSMNLRFHNPAFALALVCTAVFSSACDSASTLCNTANGDIVLSARVDDSDTNTRIELTFSEAEGSAIPRAFCTDDTVTINGQEAALIR
ncbi:MAG TPA: hypothetical protein ENK31_09000, partial [Nannocystis exedens]|nr:hypothetical protein [Nannocystis exedens]